ncbi:hypothetical protein RclHR1_00400018 [Rhizophagus clarus]|uniref:Uncharacterized protein n=1 Tax=Rhizophagus clarus TaxID=94130 RepID=A0A2Z6RFP3_9GLOM|nr:hypothetical protein RclHR1_00400018 [Rhizophagus clarus]
MDFESVFLANEDNFKEAFVNNANISNFTFKIKNFIYYNDVETAVKLGNKHLAGVLWLSHLLERRDSHAKKIKNPTAVLDALKSSSTKNNTNVSIHVTKDEDAPITYDAYVKLSDMEEYFTIENKLAYIEILAWNYRGFVGTEINKDDNEIIIKNSLYKGMLNMVRLFNHKCRQRRFLKMQLKTYFLIDGLKVSSKEFKILNVSKHFIRDDIEQAITKLIDFL